ncbi:MAG TPA: hypothetical protein VGD91_14510, partial [Trebonia sp.]
RAALQALIVSVADRAAEQVARVWRENPGGAALLAGAEASRVRDERAIAEFESAFGRSAAEEQAAAGTAKQGAFDRSTPELPRRVSHAVSAWQDQLMRLLQPEVARRVSGAVPDIAPVSVVALIAMLAAPGHLGSPGHPGSPGGAGPAAAAEDKDGIGTVPREVLASVVGDSGSTALIVRARQDLRQRVGLLLDEEMLRYGEIIDEAGPVDPVAAVRLYQAEFSLEAAR